MASIMPLRGVRYNPAHVPDLSLVVTQPYDRIGPDLRARYLQQHPQNYVRLILGDADPHLGHAENPYYSAGALYRQWLDDGVFVRAASPALYVYHQTFSLPGGEVVTRRTFMAALRLTPFDEGTVLPHERTLSAPRADRLNLFRATHVNFEPVFLLYPDAENRINAVLDAAIAGHAADVDVHESFESDVRQQLWEVSDSDVVAAVQAAMAPKRHLIVADGHHRYETALDYRDEARHAHPNAPADAPFNFALAAFVSLDDPALTILPTHRLVHSYRGMSPNELESAAERYFSVEAVSYRDSDAGRAGMELALAMRTAGEQSTAFGFVTRERQSVWRLRDRRVMADLAAERSESWRELDVAVLHQLVFERIMDLTPQSISRQENLIYLRDADAGRQAVALGEAQFMFQLNPTRIGQVRSCAEAGEKMPQKSTDFYPKMISGLVLMEL
jgi:uncharacterized protein (DUF1015 family)